MIGRDAQADAPAASPAAPPDDNDGSDLWLRYAPLAAGARRDEAVAALSEVAMPAGGPMLAAAREELVRGARGLLGIDVRFADGAAPTRFELEPAAPVGDDGFVLRRAASGLSLAARTEAGTLYGVFALLRRLQTDEDIEGESSPRYPLRMLDHWDNLDGTIERGYAGRSLWWGAEWERVPPRIRDYARANASVGINAVSLNNVNANARVLTAPYLAKVAALADVMRPWGIRVFLSARWSAPIELGGLPSADPRDERVATWWRDKAEEIYRHVPDFGGFLIKANSEGQPGPQDYGRTHADGANLLADAVAPHGGVVIWRAFVYRADVAEDRAKQAYRELTPLDGLFRPNVLVQVKNGPIDFQPREPFHPLFGAMPRTPLVLELQLAQEYLGFATHLAYLATMFEETLGTDTFANGPDTPVAGTIAAMAAVANTGDAPNWCGHPFAQANWYAFGRLAWDPMLGAEAIADEWLRMTFSHDPRFLAPAKAMMLGSREAVVDYMTPLGLHHVMAKDHHYGPGPWVDEGRADWTSVYYHRADSQGIGFDRTPAGSDAVSLYRSPLRERYADRATCPESLLLWFHHLPWDHPLHSGRTLWDELCGRYSAGLEAVRGMQRTWATIAHLIDRARAGQVRDLLEVQEREARWWRNACLLYFQSFSRRPLPPGLPPLEGTLPEYQAMKWAARPGSILPERPAS